MAGLAFDACALLQASPDRSRQLYAYYALVNLLLIADAGWIVQDLASRERVAPSVS